MIERQFYTKKRGGGWRRRNPCILIIAEGKNKTERGYFNSFNRQNSGFVIHAVGREGVTDPEGMMHLFDSEWEIQELNSKRGDIGYIVLDLDCDSSKGKTINTIQHANPHVDFIVSNPCFEVWFLMHYGPSTRSFANSAAVITALKKHMPDYQKNLNNVSGTIGTIMSHVEDALKNAVNISASYPGCIWPSNQCNPRTDVPTVVQEIKNRYLKRRLKWPPVI